jgi:hypothetical protein
MGANPAIYDALLSCDAYRTASSSNFYMGLHPPSEDNNLDLFDRAWERADTVNLVLSEMDLIKQIR